MLVALICLYAKSPWCNLNAPLNTTIAILYVDQNPHQGFLHHRDVAGAGISSNGLKSEVLPVQLSLWVLAFQFSI